MPRRKLRSDVLGTYAPERFLITLPPEFGIVDPGTEWTRTASRFSSTNM